MLIFTIKAAPEEPSVLGDEFGTESLKFEAIARGLLFRAVLSYSKWAP